MRNHLPQVLLILTFVACSGIPRNATTSVRPDLRDEEYAVYSALLNRIYNSPESGGKIKLLVINDQTSVDKVSGQAPEEVFRMYKEPLSPTLGAALRDYETKNGQPRQLTKSFDLKLAYVLVSRREFDAFFKGENSRKDWESYYRKYPDSPGYISLSRVGFSPDMTQAVVYMEYLCGSLCTDGSYIVLSKENGEWKEARQIHFWAS